jgi:hypothetical protein
MNYVDQTERHLGYLDAAAPPIARSLEITRRLAHTFPDQNRYQQDLAWIEPRVVDGVR